LYLNKAVVEEDAKSTSSGDRSFQKLLRNHIVDDFLYIGTGLIVEIVAKA
jgi:hypothetical protein